VLWNLEYEKEMKPVSSFWNRLEVSLKNVNASDIPFTDGLSKHDLRTVTKNSLTEGHVPKIVTNIYHRITKHIGKNPVLLQEVWKEVGTVFIRKFNVFLQRVRASYQNEEVNITSKFLEGVFLKIGSSK
jgi:hypothetical protein